jgi:hypothetical protein
VRALAFLPGFTTGLLHDFDTISEELKFSWCRSIIRDGSDLAAANLQTSHQSPRMPIRSPRRWIVALTVLLLLSCRDATAPGGDPLAIPDAPTREVGVEQGPVHIPIAETNANWGTLDWTGTGLKVPPWTSYIVKVSGRTTVSSNPDVPQCVPGYTPPYG